jgi:hypothetical protein
MARLYAWLSSDMSKEDVTKGGDKTINVTIHYGSKHASKDLVSLCVRWYKGDEKPIVQFDVAPDIKVITNREP